MSRDGFQSSFRHFYRNAHFEKCRKNDTRNGSGLKKTWIENQTFIATSGVRQAFLGTVTAALDPFVREADAEPEER